MESKEYLSVIDSQARLGYVISYSKSRQAHDWYRCTKHDSQHCKAQLKVERATGKVVQEYSDLNHNHPGNVESYLVLKVSDVEMNGAAGDQVIEQRAEHIATTREYTLYKSQLLETQEEKQVLDVTKVLKAMKLDSQLTLPQFLKKELGLTDIPKKMIGIFKQQYTDKAFYSNEADQSYYKNDKFLVGIEEWVSGLDQDQWLKLSTLLFNKASYEEILLLARSIVSFCNKKGMKLGKGRSKSEELVITISKDFYEQLLQEFKEEIKEEEKGSQRLVQSTLKFTSHNQLPTLSQEQSDYRCIACWEEDEPLQRTSCCRKLIHKECYQRYVQRNLDYTRPKRITEELQTLTREKKEHKEQLRVGIARLCLHCKAAIPELWDLSKAETSELKRSKTFLSGVDKAKNIIVKQVANLLWARRRRRSKLSFNIHSPIRVDSNEVTETFSDIIDLAGSDVGDLGSVEKYEFKRLKASEKALKRKLLEQQLRLVNMKSQYEYTISELHDQLYQHEVEREAELNEKLQELSMKEIAKAKQIDTATEVLVQYKDKLATTEAWLESLAYCKVDGEFEKVGAPICDAIVLPKCPLLFPKEPFKNMKIFLRQQGIPVGLVSQAVKLDCVFVQLKDSRNAFTIELLIKLRKAVSLLTLRTWLCLLKKGYRPRGKKLLKELQRLYIRQVDFTQDMLGFFMLLGELFSYKDEFGNKIPGLLQEIGALIGMQYARDYNQLLTCIQYIDFNEVKQPLRRKKIYNKFVHLLTSGQFKKKINMTLQKLLYPTYAFLQDKLLLAQDDGLSRIELSNYFHSWESYQQQFGDIVGYQNQIDSTLIAMNQLKDKLYYKVPLQLMLNSYFTFCKTQLVAYDNNIQVVCYSYNQRSHTFVGVINDRTRHSPNVLIFLKKYLAVDGNAYVFSQGKLLGEAVKSGSVMQYPIWSFNQKHPVQDVKAETEELLFSITRTNNIQITTGDKTLAEFLGIQYQRLGFQEEDQEMPWDVEEQPSETGALKDEVMQIDTSTKAPPKKSRSLLKKRHPVQVQCECGSSLCDICSPQHHIKLQRKKKEEEEESEEEAQQTPSKRKPQKKREAKAQKKQEEKEAVHKERQQLVEREKDIPAKRKKEKEEQQATKDRKKNRNIITECPECRHSMRKDTLKRHRGGKMCLAWQMNL